MGKLDGKVAMITGGASGIGAGTCRLFAAEGASVVIADILDEDGERLAAELGDQAVYVHTDVTSDAAIGAGVDLAVERFGKLDCLFNNAGAGGTEAAVEEFQANDVDHTIALLFTGVALGMKHAARVMRPAKSGAIISTASVAALQSGFGPHIYSAMKAAVVQLTKTVSTELGEDGIRVNCICPGAIVTPIFGRSAGLDPAMIQEKSAVLNELFAAAQPIRRPGQPDDIARAALWLASEESSFVNGQALVVDGGLTAGRGWTESMQAGDIIRAAIGAPPREQS